MHIVTFAFSPVTPGSQGPGVTQAAWTTPWALVYRVFQGKAPPRGPFCASTQKRKRKVSLNSLLSTAVCHS